MRSWFDPVHGQIDLNDLDLESVLESEPIRRLRRLKQLGFAAYAYPMADHSRYAHTLGTFHVARILARRVLANNAEWLESRLAELVGQFPVLVADGQDPREALARHVAAAAVLQDAGELPYEIALAGLYRPSEQLRAELSDWTAGSSGPVSDKELFTLAALRRLDIESAFKTLDAELLGTLLCGSLAIEQARNRLIVSLRNILDSSLDADRIDYVHRDALLSIGAIGNPDLVIETIKTYDVDHVVISNPAHAGALLMTRNHLYRAVYLSPIKRLKERALRTAVAAIRESKSLSQLWAPTPLPGEIGLDEFLLIDDAQIMTSVARLAEATGVSESVRLSISTLLDDSKTRYESVWVAPPDVATKGSLLKLPTGILADAVDDYARVGSFNPSFFRIDPGSFVGGNPEQDITAWIPELARSADAPIPATLLAFVPSSMDARGRSSLEQGKTDGSLYFALKHELMQQELNVPADTTDRSDFSGPAVHVSWCWDDRESVGRLVHALLRKKVKYRLLLDPFEGIGNTTKHNSRALVEDAPSLIIAASGAYLRRFRDLPSGNIAVEIAALSRRVGGSEEIPTVVVAVDDVRTVRDQFPWPQIGSDEELFVGKAISESSNDELGELAATILKRLRQDK